MRRRCSYRVYALYPRFSGDYSTLGTRSYEELASPRYFKTVQVYKARRSKRPPVTVVDGEREGSVRTDGEQRGWRRRVPPGPPHLRRDGAPGRQGRDLVSQMISLSSDNHFPLYIPLTLFSPYPIL